MCVCERKRESVCVCVCVFVRERERERERERGGGGGGEIIANKWTKGCGRCSCTGSDVASDTSLAWREFAGGLYRAGRGGGGEGYRFPWGGRRRYGEAWHRF